MKLGQAKHPANNKELDLYPFGSSLDDRPWPPDHHISCAQEFLCSGNVRRIENEEAIPFYRNRLFILQSPHISCGREFLVKGNVMGMKDGEEKNPFQRNF